MTTAHGSPWADGLVETRAEGSGYTDQVLAAISASASGRTSALETAALEIAAGMYERAFAIADVTPDPAAAALGPDVLGLIGRELTTAGEAVFLIDVTSAGPMLIPAASWDVRGGPRSIRYQLDLAGPEQVESYSAPAAAVVHVRRGRRALRPWQGRAPWEAASTTATLTARLERRLAEEASTPVGYVLPVPQGNVQALANDIAAIKGGIKPVESSSTNWDQGGAAPRGDYQQQRLGPNPPAPLDALRTAVMRDVLAACGIPASLLGVSDGTATREGYRQWLHGSLAPLGALVVAELRVKLEQPELAIGFERLFAADLAGRARAFGSMVKAGMDVARAAALAGLLEEAE